MPVGDQDKPWAPHFTCENCKKTLEGWYREKKRATKFTIPKIQRKLTCHSSNYYFCMVEPSKCRAGKNASATMYPGLPSSITPVSHCTHSAREKSVISKESSKSEEEVDVEDLDYNFTSAAGERDPHYPNQRDLNDSIRDLDLTKLNAETIFGG